MEHGLEMFNGGLLASVDYIWSEAGSASKSIVGADPCVCPLYIVKQVFNLFTRRENAG